MTALTVSDGMDPQLAAGVTVVLEAAGGIIRTVLGLLQGEELLVLVPVDSALCQALQRPEHVRVTRADGRVFDAAAEAMATQPQSRLAQLQDRLIALGGTSRPAHVYRLVLGVVLVSDLGGAPRT